VSPRRNGDHDHRSVDQIERDLDETRNRIELRARELQERLSPSEIFDQVIDRFRSSRGKEFFSNLGRTASENPVPVTLSAVALGWLALSARRTRDGHAYGPHEDDGPGMKEKAGEAMHRAGERARSAGPPLKEKGRDLGDRLRSGQDRVQDTWQRLTHEQPMVLGLLALAGGALLAASLPPSETEDELLGDASDELKRKAVEHGREQLEDVRERVSESQGRPGYQGSTGSEPQGRPGCQGSTGAG
jgi:hypothetical protein